MSRLRVFLSVLTLTASLASCAPAVTGPGGQPIRVVRGEAFVAAQTLPLAQLDSQTADTAYITFPDCTGAAVLVADVRRLGPETTNSACKRVASASQISAGEVLLIGAGGAALGIVIFLALARAYTSRIP